MAADSVELQRLLQRAERSFRATSPTEIIGSRRAIIGPRSDLLGSDAEKARQLLVADKKPSARELAALEQAIRLQRPAPACQPDGLTPLPFARNWLAESWTTFQPVLKRIQGSVARLERVDDPEPSLGTGRTALGTGFLVAPDLLMTAAHVVDELSFSTGELEIGQAVADFHAYLSTGDSDVVNIVEVANFDPVLDLAILRIEPVDIDNEKRPLLLPTGSPTEVGQAICVIGHPLEDPRNPSAFVAIVFGNRFGVKRASVGEIMHRDPQLFFHDCSTLGGNSGSPVVDLATGEVCGVHVSGRAMMRNVAVPAQLAHEFLKRPHVGGRTQTTESPRNRRTSVQKHAKTSFDDFFLELKKSDPDIHTEIVNEMNESGVNESTSTESSRMMFETIVLTKGRPVLDIKGGDTVIAIEELESQIWKDRLRASKPLLKDHIPAVGRIEIANHPRGVEWLGTGWLIRDNIIVTNRHVAEVFGEAEGEDFIFRPGFDESPMRAQIDFLEEFDGEGSHEFPLFHIVHIERGGGPDLAFLRIEPVPGQSLPSPVPLSTESATNGEHVAVIGYPARDSFFPDPELMDRIFNHRYDKKRLAPGLITGKSSTRVFHDCSTLGGNSGGEVVSLKSGKAVALHFAGTLFTKNHAVPLELIGERLDAVLKKAPASGSSGSQGERPKGQSASPSTGTSRVVEATIPIRVRVEIGDVEVAAMATALPSGTTRPRPLTAAPQSEDDLIETVEAKPEDYRGRKGYDPKFLGAAFVVPLPVLTKNKSDILKFTFDGESRQVLDYQHFSVLMSINRRICRFSACNIDGKNSKKRKRTGWQIDPRIAKKAQIMGECYGNPPKFSRGHMTRREDPVWGPDNDASRGNSDSMHVTNAVPQIQPFNAGIWLNLEDYALDNAREDDMRISVFTGPFLANNDPVRFNVKIPISFWKVIAFIHDETGKLCATGYTMSQKSFLSGDEFVFGEHENHQRPIAEIEQRAGISFGNLADVDPLKDQDEAVPTMLTHPNQIRFV